MSATNKITSISEYSALGGVRSEAAVARSEQAPAEGAARRRVLLQTMAPKLDAPEEKPLNYLEAVIAFMMAMTSSNVSTAKRQSDIGMILSHIGEQLVQHANVKMDDVAHAIKKASETPTWVKVLKVIGIVASAGALLIGAAIGSAAIAVIGAISLVLQASGAFDALASATESMHPLAKVAISLAVAVGTAAVATAAIGAIAGSVAAAFTLPAMAAGTIAVGVADGLFTNLMAGIVQAVGFVIKQCGGKVNKEAMDDASLYLGLIVGLVAAFGSSAVSAGPTGAVVAQTQFMRVAQGVCALVKANADIGQGAARLKHADAIQTLSNAKAGFELCMSLVSQTQSVQKEQQAAGQNAFEAITEMNSHWEEFIDSYRKGTEVMA